MSRLGLIVAMLAVQALCLTSAELINSRVERTIDLSTQLVQDTARVTLLNTDTSKTVTEFVIAVPESLAEHVAHVSVSSANRASLPVRSTSKANEWTVQLGNSLQIAPQSESEPIQIQFVITRQLRPHPEQISQHDPQLVLYSGDYVWYSPYESRWQQTRVRLPTSGLVESYSKPGQRQENQILYGPFERVAAQTRRALTVHFQTSASMLLVNSLQRTVQVAPWSGKVHVEDWIDVWHSGAKLMDSFSRYEYQKDPSDAPAAIKVLRARLPKSAFDVFYRDEIG